MATHSKQITYNPVLLAVTEMGGKSGASSQGRDVNPARALRKAPKERCTVILGLEGLSSNIGKAVRQGRSMVYPPRPNYLRR